MNIEELQEQILVLKENIETLTDDNKSLRQQLEDKNLRVDELEKYNQKLFLRATATHNPQSEEKETFKSKLLGDYINLLDNDEIELLKELEEDL